MIAGLSTGIGSGLAFFARRTNTQFLSLSLGFSAGVLVYVSFVEIFTEAQAQLTHAHGLKVGDTLAVAAFFGGMLLIAVIDRLVPSFENPHSARAIEDMAHPAERHHLIRIGLLSALAIAIHNFPEGLAVFVGAISEPTVGISIAVAVAIHNIPEGISIAVPVYYATGSRVKAFWLSFASGLSEPLGALVGYGLLWPWLSDALLGAVYAAVAGIMVFIALDQLLPNARRFGGAHRAMHGLIAGMAIIALTLLLLL